MLHVDISTKIKNKILDGWELIYNGDDDGTRSLD